MRNPHVQNRFLCLHTLMAKMITPVQFQFYLHTPKKPHFSYQSVTLHCACLNIYHIEKPFN